MRASSIGTISFLRIRQFLQRNYSVIEGRSRSTDREPRLINDRPDAPEKIKVVQRESEVRLVQMFDRMIALWRPAVAEFEDGLSLIVSDAKQEARN
jgi:hypothetical protein